MKKVSLFIVCILLWSNLIYAQFVANYSMLPYVKTYYGFNDSLAASIEKIYVQNLQRVPENISSYKNLKELSIIGNDWDNIFTQIPDSFYNLKTLQYLKIANTDLGFISPQIKNMTTLKFLDVSRNRLLELPQELSTLPNLKTIYITSSIEKVPDLPQVEHLNYYYWSINDDDTTKMFPNIAAMKQLKSISIDGSSYFNFADLINKIKDLKSISSIYIDLSVIRDEDFIEISKIESLKSFSCEELSAEPSTISRFKNLEHLKFLGLAVEKEKYKSSVDAIQSLPNLKTLNTRFDTSWVFNLNEKSKINFEVYINYDDFYSYYYNDNIIPILAKFNIDSLKIYGRSNLPKIEQLKQLRVLDLLSYSYEVSNKYILNNLSQLPNLESIYFNKSFFEENIPEELSQLKQLKNIYINNVKPYYFYESDFVITEEIKAKLKQLLPSCNFYYYE